MAKIIKASNMKAIIAALIVISLNPGNVMLWHGCLLTDVEPKDLYYPEGWCYSKGNLRNVKKIKSLFYGKIPMALNSGISWREFAQYSTCKDHTTKTIEMCDVDVYAISDVFKLLNPNEVELRRDCMGPVIATNVEPKDLVYPQGWYYEKGCLCNKCEKRNTIHKEIPLVRHSGKSWRAYATYRTPKK